MAKKTAPLLPSSNALLLQFGERLRLARLRRGLTARQVCERAGMAPMTLRSLERGGSGVTIGAYLAVMQVLGIEQDLQLLGQADTVGRSLQDARLPAPRAASTRTAARPHHTPHVQQPAMQEMARLAGESGASEQQAAPGMDDMQRLATHRHIEETAFNDWIKGSDFISSDTLANLIAAPTVKTVKQGK